MPHTTEEIKKATNWWVSQTDLNNRFLIDKYQLYDKNLTNDIMIEVYNAEHSRAHKPTEDKELFTKGEWMADLSGINPQINRGVHGLALIYSGIGEEKEVKANALLIAASPNLYHALKDIVGIAVDRWRSLPAHSHEKKCLNAAIEAINKAIK